MQTRSDRTNESGIFARRTQSLIFLLVFIVLLQFGYPITDYGEIWTGLYMLLYAGMIFFGVLVVREEGQHPRGIILLGAVFALFGVWFSFAQDSTPVTLAMLTSVAAFMLALMLSLARFIFRRGAAVGIDLVTAAVCVYLIMGGFFGAIFAIVENVDPGSFEDPSTPGESPAWQQLVYYSYVTMATLGYGEILPITAWARSLASFETVAGTLFLTIVVARLVGNWASASTAPSPPRPSRP
ncbi:potassium channel family protein [Phytoactinopolyspora halotolerans]|uniref:Two pore domain potassium channel family protein n=1 Tax=Phytoactinopolyspora halotolerans TaxID=1981512 RepID=A0A6L9SG31_9ACTN|nr:potassium channel family protein [Phytoactinopolyspora halotolerans]NEE03598.1 two pore domain potassium channel family protein [Phytoactinopolyspora halotolerans]